MKLILFLSIFVFSSLAFSFLIPNPNVEFDIQMQQDPLKKRDSFLKYSNEYYDAYLAEFRKINNLAVDPFMPSLRNEISDYFKHLSDSEINSMTNQQVTTFMREQLADQLYIPYSKENSEGLIKDATVNLEKVSSKVDQLERKLFNQIAASKKVSIGGSGEGFSLDYVYLVAIIVLGGIIFLLSIPKNNTKKAK